MILNESLSEREILKNLISAVTSSKIYRKESTYWINSSLFKSIVNRVDLSSDLPLGDWFNSFREESEHYSFKSSSRAIMSLNVSISKKLKYKIQSLE